MPPSFPTDAPTTEAIRHLGASLITPELIIFPVRHHSPGCAWHLRKLFSERPPCAVLVEGPRSFTPLIPLLTHADARMPLAVYSYAVQRRDGGEADARHAAYYPLCDYSPELVALRAAAEHGIPARFIDLDYAEQSLFESSETDDGQQDRPDSLLDEFHYRRSQYLRALATRLGCRDHEELWEHLFEIPAPSRDTATHITDVAAYCQLARLDSTQAQLRADGTLQREAEMAWHIAQALAQRTPEQGPVLAVVGGFHAVVLPQLVAAAGARPSLPQGRTVDQSSALIRYSFDRLDRLNGYASGMTSPAWHQRLWERQLKHERAGLEASARVRHEIALELLFDIALELRKRHHISLPMPALSAAYEQLLQLARLRQRAAPARDDLRDAIGSCFIKGDTDADGALVHAVVHRLLGGEDIGKVPPGAGTPPLVKDFEYRARRQRLKLDSSQPRKLSLDLYRRPEHRITSRLLHGALLLGVPFAFRSGGPDFVNGFHLNRLQEHWEYAWSAATEAALVEASMYGVTLPLAVAARFVSQLDRLQAEGIPDAGDAAQWLVKACVLGLHDHLRRIIGLVRDTVGNDADFKSVTRAAAGIGLLWESREPLEARDATELPDLLQTTYERAIYLGTQLRGVASDDAGLIEALAQLRELLIRDVGQSLDADLYWNMVTTLHSAHPASVMRGACAGLLYAAGRLDEAALAVTLAGHLDGLLAPADSVGFLRGLLQTARESAWQQPQLLQSLNRLLREWDEPQFVALLPELRLAFSQMTPKETDRIAEAVSQLHAGKTLGALVDYQHDEGEILENLRISQQLREILAEDGLGGWMQ